MNSSQVFFPKLETLQFSELEALRAKMDAQSEPDLDILMRSIGVPVTKDKFEIDDGIPIVQNRKSVLYIQEPKNFKGSVSLPKYHILHCSTLKEMQEKGQYHRYHAASPTDGKFRLKLSSTSTLSSHELVLCRFCLNELRSRFGWDIFPEKPEDFPLADWLEPFFNYSSGEWQKRSQKCREKANWKCEQCRIDLNNDRRFLVAHHKWGTRFNDPQDLMALCIRCHAEQPGGGHITLKYKPDYQEFMSKYGKR
ncbi:MAG: hypothetical protein OXC79_03895 [Candidatus Poribacteria bacterium]|nr:hypothetical protein [Candidatus Poribacteria bacterium]